MQEQTTSPVAIVGLQSGETYDFPAADGQSGSFASPATAINGYYVIGRAGPPDDLQNLSLATIGGQALLRCKPRPTSTCRWAAGSCSVIRRT